MYYSSGNYEAFARPKKPEGVDNKSAYIVGSGLAALTAACYLVRDGQMKGEHIHILEKGELPGGACDGYKFENLGYVMRGGREMDNHFEVMWDLFRSIPSIETEGASVLDEYYWLNKEDPNYSLCRATVDRGQDAHTDGKFDISDKGAMEIMKLFFTPNEDLQDKKITDFFDDEVLNSNFWLYWRTMFAFENWHSALEMKLYIQRYIHHIGGLPDFTALRFTKYNQYESMILPMVKYLESHNVRFHYGVQVTNVEFDCSDPAHKLAKQQVGAQTAGNRNAVDHRLLRLGQLDGDLAGRRALVAVGATGERCHEAKDGRRKERRQGSLGAQQRELPKLGAKATHAVADPAAQTSDNAGQAGLRSNAAAKQQRQQCRERKLVQVVVGVVPVLLDLSHHLVEVIGPGARHLFVQTD